MDLQASQATKEKTSILSRLTVAFCLLLTAGLLISSLVAPSKAQTKQVRSPATITVQL